MQAAKINPETEEASDHMVMSMMPNGRILITQPWAEKFLTPGEKFSEKFANAFRACSDAPLTRVVDMTEMGFSNFCAWARMINPAAEPVYPTLAMYPRPAR